LRFEADKETDEQKKTQTEAIWALRISELDGMRRQNTNDERLMAQYET
jgi:hypothetical protein